MLSKKNLDFLFTSLHKLYPEAKSELDFSTPFQTLAAVMLSAQTTDKQVNKTTANIFKNIKTATDLRKTYTLASLTKALSSLNLYKTKAKHLRETALLLQEQKNSIPNTLPELMKLPGIGEKSAKVIMHILYDAPLIGVDTHVHRVANRLGLVTTKTPLQTSKLLETAIPKKYTTIAHDTLVLRGRYECTARKPKCENCPFRSFCTYTPGTL